MSNISTTILLGFVVVICTIHNSEAGPGQEGNGNEEGTQNVAEDQAPVDWKAEIAALCEALDTVTNLNKKSEVVTCMEKKTVPKDIHQCLDKIILDHYYPIINEAKFYNEHEETAETRASLKDIIARYMLLLIERNVTVEEAPEYEILNDIGNDFDRNAVKTTKLDSK